METIKVQWIPVTERVPEDNREYLAYSPTWGMVVILAEHFKRVGITHWTDTTLEPPHENEE